MIKRANRSWKLAWELLRKTRPKNLLFKIGPGLLIIIKYPVIDILNGVFKTKFYYVLYVLCRQNWQ